MAVLGDQETRQRLLEAAAKLFAERGFKNTSVRDICAEAGANVAAVNYHFRDKLGLYKEVVGMVADAMDTGKREAMEVAEGTSAEDQLRSYILHFLRQCFGEEKSWIDDLISRELAEPTPAFDLIVQRGIAPNAFRLGKLISKLTGLPPEDYRVQLCGASIQAQCVFYRSGKTVMKHMNPGLEITPEVIEGIARQIADFSLAGIRAVAQQKAERKP